MSNSFSIGAPELLNRRRRRICRYPIRGGTTIKFDELFDQAAPLIAAGEHARDVPPSEGGRWPVSVMLPASTALLDDLTAEAAELAGPGHWQTGQLGSAHFTVRALEGYRAEIPADDPAVQRYLNAMRRAGTGPFRMRVTGLTLTPGSVMASAEAVDSTADDYLDRFAEELGPDGWFERPHGRRDIWYVNLLHFTGEIPDPAKLIDWVAERRRLEPTEVVVPATELVRFRLVGGDRPHMRPVTL
jgi:hypothetical protein